MSCGGVSSPPTGPAPGPFIYVRQKETVMEFYREPGSSTNRISFLNDDITSNRRMSRLF